MSNIFFLVSVMNYFKSSLKLLVIPFWFMGLNLLAEPISGENFSLIKKLLATHELSDLQVAELSDIVFSDLSEKRPRPESRVLEQEASFLQPQKKAKVTIEPLEKPKPFIDLTNIPDTPPKAVAPSRFAASTGYEVSPIKPKETGGLGEAIRHNAVYLWIAIDDDQSYIPPQDVRIDFGALLGDDPHITKRSLYAALANTERQISEILKERPKLFYRTVYVGLTQNLGDRSVGHRSELRVIDRLDLPGEERAYYSSKKISFYDEIYTQHQLKIYNCALVYNVPEKLLPLVEVMVGNHFGVLHKGNTLLGNKLAWEKFAAYAQSRYRKKIDVTVVERLHDSMIRCLINPPIM